MPKFDFSYDPENDDLFLYNPKTRSKGSVELGNLVLDFNTKKEFAGLQVMDASKFISEIVEVKLSDVKKILANLEKCRVETKSKGNLLIIKIFLFSGKQELHPVITLPRITQQSPSLAYA